MERKRETIYVRAPPLLYLGLANDAKIVLHSVERGRNEGTSTTGAFLPVWQVRSQCEPSYIVTLGTNTRM